MAIRNITLGGKRIWVSKESLYPEDLNDTFDILFVKSLINHDEV